MFSSNLISVIWVNLYQEKVIINVSMTLLYDILSQEKKKNPLPGCGHCSHTEGMLPTTCMSILHFQVDDCYHTKWMVTHYLHSSSTTTFVGNQRGLFCWVKEILQKCHSHSVKSRTPYMSTNSLFGTRENTGKGTRYTHYKKLIAFKIISNHSK